jgi:hypothetical protein
MLLLLLLLLVVASEIWLIHIVTIIHLFDIKSTFIV